MRKLTTGLLLSIVSGCLFSMQAQADCSSVAMATNPTVNFGVITAQRDLSIGGDIVTKVIPAGNNLIANGCYDDIREKVSVNLANYPLIGNKLFESGVKGVGIRIKVNDVQIGSTFLIQSQAGSQNNSRYSPKIEVTLVKTGDITPGKVSMGPILTLAEYSSGAYKDALTYRVSSGGITQALCEITGSASIPVEMGTAQVTDFNGKGSTLPPVDVTIPLECNSGTSVNISFDATSSHQNGIIDLNSGSSAEGIGIQLKLKDIPVLFNHALFVAETTGQGKFDIPLTASYIQTDDSIKAGLASAVANFTVTYE